MNDRTLEDLFDLKARIEGDIRRSRMQDLDGLSRNSPLMKNYEQVQNDIANWKLPEAPVAESVVLDEKKIEVGSVEHMTHALHAHHTGSSGIPSYNSLGGNDGHSNYHFHHMGSTAPALTGNPNEGNRVARYLVVHKHSPTPEAHHFTVQAVKSKKDKNGYDLNQNTTYDVKHVAKVM